jgi:hypothetical protein
MAARKSSFIARDVRKRFLQHNLNAYANDILPFYRFAFLEILSFLLVFAKFES